jgi:hypothetical protein
VLTLLSITNGWDDVTEPNWQYNGSVWLTDSVSLMITVVPPELGP